jgi:carbon-monoxide dehydrogenase medium subunit
LKAAAFDYVKPPDIAGALKALASGDAKLLAGGQSLGPMLNLRLVRTQLLVDISDVEALRSVEQRGSSVRIGASVTHAEIEDARKGLPRKSMLRAVAAGIAYRSVRNRGTIGGSLAHADPAADWPLALAALEAKLHVRGPKGARTVAAAEFVKGAFTTDLGDDELIEAIEVPKLSTGARWGYYKFCRKTGEFPEASAAIVLDPERRVARVLLGALNGAPRQCEALARELAQGRTPDGAACAQAVQEAVPELDAVDRQMHAATLARAINTIQPS